MVRVIRMSAVCAAACVLLRLALRCECDCDGCGLSVAVLRPVPSSARRGWRMRQQRPLLDLSTWTHGHFGCSTGRTDHGPRRSRRKNESRDTRGDSQQRCRGNIHAQSKATRTMARAITRQHRPACSTHETVAIASCEHRPWTWNSLSKEKKIAQKGGDLIKFVWKSRMCERGTSFDCTAELSSSIMRPCNLA